jgi:hypothetical protein
MCPSEHTKLTYIFILVLMINIILYKVKKNITYTTLALKASFDEQHLQIIKLIVV